MEAFEHSNQLNHDEELSGGADIAIIKLLVFLIQTEASDDIVLLALQTLEATLRASSEAVGRAFDAWGTQLLTVLVHLLDSDLRRRGKIRRQDESSDSSAKEILSLREVSSADHESDDSVDQKQVPTESTADQDAILQKVTTIIGHLARVGTATRTIAHHKGLLGSLVHLAAEVVPWEARLTALWVIANLACCDENMEMMVCAPNLLPCLIHVACRPLPPDTSLEQTMDIVRSRLLSSRTIFNLSWSASNKLILAEHTALVDMLCQLAVKRTSHLSRSRTVQECLQSTRRHALGALRNLATASRRTKINLANGRLLDVLTDVALEDDDEKTKDRAFSAIDNLATHDTAEQIVNRPALVLALKGALMGDYGQVAKQHASSTLMVLERTITHDSLSFGTLRGLLETNIDDGGEDLAAV